MAAAKPIPIVAPRASECRWAAVTLVRNPNVKQPNILGNGRDVWLDCPDVIVDEVWPDCADTAGEGVEAGAGPIAATKAAMAPDMASNLYVLLGGPVQFAA
jgi:hypothetical protein